MGFSGTGTGTGTEQVWKNAFGAFPHLLGSRVVLLERLTLHDFRNFGTCELELGARFTVLFGHNGAGKTNLLEAIYLVSTLRSFRTSDRSAMIRRDAHSGSVDLRAHDPGLDLSTTLGVRLERRGSGARRAAVADGKHVRSAADFYGRIRAVLFTPEDLGVLRGAPAGRRQFLDRMLFARERTHIADIAAYDKLVRSRNHVLRDESGSAHAEHLLETYETGLAEYGGRIWTRRTELLDELEGPFAAAFARIHGQAGPAPQDAGAQALTAQVRHASKLGDVEPAQRRSVLLEALRDRRREDRRRGATSVGPHRDDIEVELDGRPAADFASQGQARALVLAFKLAEVQVAHAATRTRPLLLLDDVSSELDPRRSALLFATLAQDVGQCVLTTTSPRHIELPSDAQARSWHVDRGCIRPADAAQDSPAAGAQAGREGR
jgi:DNA replication and repair protein RecF